MNILPQKRLWILLAKHFAGETNAREESELADLRRKTKYNDLHHKIKTDWRSFDKMKTQFNTDVAWAKLHERLVGNNLVNPAGSQHKQKHFLVSNHYRLVFRIAASVILVAAIGFVLYSTGILSGLNYRTISVTTGQNDEIRNITLPDGSVVYLNSDTKFTYPKKFGNKSRQVSLTGEAFFNVTAYEANPFIINAGGAVVKAVGTSFNVNALNGEPQVEVYVESGKVELIEATHSDNRVLLEPGHLGTFSRDKIDRKISDNKNCIAWKTKQMEFHNTELSVVLNILEDVYKVEIIVLDPDIETTQIIGEYSNDPLDVILEIICTQNNLKIEKSDNKVYLSHM